MTRRNRRSSLLLACASLAFLAVLGSCAAGPVGIFASIAQETDINAGRTKAFIDTNASFIGRLDSGNYYAIVGTGLLYQRPVDGSWSKYTPVSGLSDSFAQSAAVVGSTLYLVLGANTPRIYSSDGVDSTLLVFNPLEERIVRVLSAATQLFAVTEQVVSGNRTGKYYVYSYDGTNFNLAYDGTPEGAEISLPNSAAFDGTNYWLDGGYIKTASDNKVLTGSPGSLSVTAAAPPHRVTGVAYHDGFIYASTSNGRILRTSDGSTWTVSGEFRNNNNVAINFTAPSILSFASSTILLAGTSNGARQNAGNGYYEIALNTLEQISPRTITTTTNFDTSLNGKSMIGLPHFSEGVGIRVFGLTIKDGLWSNYYNGETWSGWARE